MQSTSNALPTGLRANPVWNIATYQLHFLSHNLLNISAACRKRNEHSKAVISRRHTSLKLLSRRAEKKLLHRV